VKGLRGVLVGAVITCLVLMAFLPSYPLTQPGQWVDINQVSAPLRSIFMLSSTAGWAVGDNGTILNWNGEQWSLVQSPTPLNLTSVFFPDASNPNDGWIVGKTDGSYPTILHWDGVSWVKLDTTNGISWPAGLVGDLYGLYFLTPSDGWAVGAPGSFTNMIHWSGRWEAGGSWTKKATPDITATLYSVQVNSNTVSPVGGYAVGGKTGSQGVIFYWDGSNWNTYTGTVPTAYLRSISLVNSTLGWAVGDAIGTNPTVIHLSGATWSGPVSLSGLGIRSLYSVLATDASDAYAVGTLAGAGATDIIRFTTPSWSAVVSPATVDLFSICMTKTGTQDIWAVGSWGTILRYSGGKWTTLTSPVGAGNLMVTSPTPPSDLQSVHFTTASDGWAVGETGTIIRYDGTSWSNYRQTPLVSSNLYSVYTVSSTDGYAVGGNGTILRLMYSGWGVVAQCPGPTCVQNTTLRSVFELSTGEAWAVGDAMNASYRATILRWLPGTTPAWSAVPSNTPYNASLNSLFMLADGTEGWAVGYNATHTLIDHWKNGVWTVVTYNPPFSGALKLDSVVVVNNSPSNVWATGTSSGVGGIALHYDGTAWSPNPLNQAGLTGWAAIGFAPGLTNDAWIVGGPGNATGGQTVHWDGTSWTNIPLVPRPFVFPTFRSLQMLSTNDGWAVGDQGHIIRLGPKPLATTTITSTSIISSTTVVTTLVTTTLSTTSSTTSSTTNSTTTTTSIPPSPIPGFPIESILAGLLGGVIALAAIRRRRRL
jgi:hypothetical protein